MDSRLFRRVAALCIVCLCALPAGRATAFTPSVISAISTAPGGLPPNGSSDDPAFSQDNRDVRYVAYDSFASNLVPTDTNGRRDVFVLAKTAGDGQVGGRLSLVSVSSRGRQGNGDSSKPSVDGTTGAVPHCIAFQSTATNFDRADRSADSDIYMRDLRAKTTGLVSVGITNAINASIDGRCRFVVFEANGRLYDRDLVHGRTLRLGSGANPDQQTDGRGLAYQSNGQVWYQALTLGRHGLKLRGHRRLVSSTPAGTPASGLSENASVDDHGRYVAFDSTATDICTLHRCGWQYHPPPNWRTLDPGATPDGIDANGAVSDVYLAKIKLPSYTPDAQAMALVSYDYGYDQLTGPSVDPQVSRAGQAVVFTSGPFNALANGIHAPAPENIFGWTDVLHSFGHGHLHVRSEQWSCNGLDCRTPEFTAPSIDPAMSSRGNYIAFTSTQSGANAIANVFLEFVQGAPHNGG
ncbi:MAG TPA: hypothetical protein VJU60_07565 [Thermoleophilaceae bacterium]|nr:hypothetical protein [Thermoleophilaceae bacterium]